MIQMNDPTVEDVVLGITYHSKKTINFLIADEAKEIDVVIYFDETSGEGGRDMDSDVISVKIGETYAWSKGDEGDMGLRINETITSEVGKMFEDCDFTQEAQSAISDKIEEKIDDELCGIGD